MQVMKPPLMAMTNTNYVIHSDNYLLSVRTRIFAHEVRSSKFSLPLMGRYSISNLSRILSYLALFPIKVLYGSYTKGINTRIINNYRMKDCNMHGKKRNFFMLIMISSNIHLDALNKVNEIWHLPIFLNHQIHMFSYTHFYDWYHHRSCFCIL